MNLRLNEPDTREGELVVGAVLSMASDVCQVEVPLLLVPDLER